jgi:hypothetical protein
MAMSGSCPAGELEITFATSVVRYLTERQLPVAFSKAEKTAPRAAPGFAPEPMKLS